MYIYNKLTKSNMYFPLKGHFYMVEAKIAICIMADINGMHVSLYIQHKVTINQLTRRNSRFLKIQNKLWDNSVIIKLSKV